MNESLHHEYPRRDMAFHHYDKQAKYPMMDRCNNHDIKIRDFDSGVRIRSWKFE